MSESKLKSAADLFRRLPPSQLDVNLNFAVQLLGDDYDTADELLETIDCPLKVRTDGNGNQFIVSDYNRDGDSYRSPHDNKYYPEFENGGKPSGDLRKLEIQANALFSQYTQQYYEGGICSCYFWDVEDGFAAAILIQKDGSGVRGCEKGIWDSMHVIQCTPANGQANYNLISTIILSIASKKGESNSKLDLSGYMQKEISKKGSYKEQRDHLVTIGNMIQDQENTMRDELQFVHFDKAREITRVLRDPNSGKKALSKNLMQEMASAMANRRR